MLTDLHHLGLEVKYLDRARAFYVDGLGLEPVRETATELAFRVGSAELVLRRPSRVPRGGLHVHYAFEAPRAEYDAWYERMAATGADPEEHQFGSYRSVYADDPDDHCVEIGGRETEGNGLAGIFEVVLEVASLDPAVERYEGLGFEAVDRGGDRRRVRLDGPVELELWEPQLGLADARGGVHVDLGFSTRDPDAAADAVATCPDARESVGAGVRVRECDGHVLTFVEETA